MPKVNRKVRGETYKHEDATNHFWRMLPRWQKTNEGKWVLILNNRAFTFVPYRSKKLLTKKINELNARAEKLGKRGVLVTTGVDFIPRRKQAA